MGQNTISYTETKDCLPTSFISSTGTRYNGIISLSLKKLGQCCYTGDSIQKLWLYVEPGAKYLMRWFIGYGLLGCYGIIQWDQWQRRSGTCSLLWHGEVQQRAEHVTHLNVLTAVATRVWWVMGWSYLKEWWGRRGLTRDESILLCVVDILARTGHLAGAKELASLTSVEAGGNVWKALLGGSQSPHDIKLVEATCCKLEDYT